MDRESIILFIKKINDVSNVYKQILPATDRTPKEIIHQQYMVGEGWSAQLLNLPLLNN